MFNHRREKGVRIMKLSLEAQEYWTHWFIKQAFDKRYAYYRGMSAKQRMAKVAEHIVKFMNGEFLKGESL
jgi:hypothetical protein